MDGSTAMWIGIALAAAAAWLLWRERHVLGRHWAVTFWILRLAAFACVLWMLAGPAELLVERQTKVQSIALFADGSESMDTVDPLDPTAAIRWALAADEDVDETPVACADSLAVSLAAMQKESDELQRMINDHHSTRPLAEKLTSLQRLAANASDHADALGSTFADDDTLAAPAAQLADLLDASVGVALNAIQAGISDSAHSVAPDFTPHFDQLSEGIAAARRRAAVLAVEVAERQASQLAPLLAEVNGLTRREQVARVLDALERALTERRSDAIAVRRYRFDRAVSLVDVNDGWERELVPTSASSFRGAALDSFGTNGDVPSGGATNLSAVFEQLAGDQSVAALRLAVVFTDGRHNDPDAAPPQQIASHLAGLPVYVVPIGSASPVRDIRLHRVEAPSAVRENDSAIIDLIVTGLNCDGQMADVVLRHDGQEIDRKTVEFAGSRGDRRAQFFVPTHELGWQEYLVEVEPIDDEANTANNYQLVSFEVVRNQTRVLLADAGARWEYQYLNQLFRRDDQVQFDELLFLPSLQGSGFLAEHGGLPDNVDDWSRYDVVILGDLGTEQLFLPCQRSLAEYVRKRGGDLIVVAGKFAMPASFVGQPLLDLLPVEQSLSVFPGQPYLIRMAADGNFHSALLIENTLEESRQVWRRVYERQPVYDLSEYSKPKPTARTLLEAVRKDVVDADTVDAASVAGDGTVHAFLCWHQVGAGRVAYLAAPATYRLRWRRGDRIHHHFWGQLLRWITASSSGGGEDLVRIQTDRMRYILGEPVDVTVWLKNPSGRPLGGETLRAEARARNDDVFTADLAPDADSPGRYFGTLVGLAAGSYDIGVSGPILDDLLPPGAQEQIDWTVTVHAPENVELLNTQSNRALLEQLATVTGGQVVPPTALGEVLQLFAFAPEVTERIERKPLWNRWLSLFIVLGCVFFEWIVRKRKGLV